MPIVDRYESRISSSTVGPGQVEDIMRTLGFAALCFLVLAALPTAANADSISFTLTSNTTTISFTLPETVTFGPEISIFSGPPAGFNGFQIANVSMLLNGSPVTEDINFFVTALGGGFEIFNGSTMVDLANQAGPQLFSVNSMNPFSATFIPGTFGLTFAEGNPGPETITGDMTLNIVPEPSSMLLFGTGLLGLGGVLRRKLRP